MRTRTLFLLAILLTGGRAPAADYPVEPVPFTAVRLTGGFWHVKQETNRTVTLPFALSQCEDSGRLRNFDLAAETLRRRAAGEKGFQNKPVTDFPFDDSDVYKEIEGASYVLSTNPDAALEHRIDGWIDRIIAAQEPDGYLYTFRTMHPDSPVHKWIGRRRWERDPFLSHELYDTGHLYEAGVANFQATGKRKLLDACLRSAELLWRDFGDDRPIVAPGHQIVEMGLVKLYRVTGDTRYLLLAKKFLDARGPRGPEYNQRHKRVVDQDEAVGHAVRANYMYCGMADVAALTGDQRYAAAIDRIWQNVVEKKLYLTGGVGALEHNEAYGGDYDLPDEGYNETCAAVSFMMWNHRMFLMSGDSKYMDVFERTAYNGFISGVSESGDRFFYTNPLAYDGKARNNSSCAGRAPWFGCACCPPNLMRTLASLGGYFYAVRGDSLFVNLFGQSEAHALVAGIDVGIAQSTRYPWDGGVRIEVTPEHASRFSLRIRIPGWVQGNPLPTDLYHYEPVAPSQWSVRVDGEAVPSELRDGYVVIDRVWQRGDSVLVDFPIRVRAVRGNPLLASTLDRVAFERGPIVYCVENLDSRRTLGELSVPPAATVVPSFRADLLGGVTVLTIDGARIAPDLGVTRLTAIPYYAWNNRGLAPMTVWMERGF
jgi:DUF1680 family protein